MQVIRQAMGALFAVALCAAAGCSSDSSTAPTMASVAGTWNLQTVNGTSLPYTISQTGSNSSKLTAETITATNTGSFTSMTTYETTFNGQTTTSTSPDAGTFTLNGTAVNFTFNSNGSTGTGSISGNTLTVAENGFAFVFVKQ